jgi:hypothetical protein
MRRIASPGSVIRAHISQASEPSKRAVDYQKVARDMFLATDVAKAMKEAGLTPPTTTTKGFSVMGKMFDPAKPDAYVESFSIRAPDGRRCV